MAKSRAQQAAIAISMKKAGKKPKRMLKGGKSKTLNKVSKQLAKASKLHAAQSKKIGKLARTMQKGGEYTVQSGDYMSTIAKKYNMSTSELMALNPQVNEKGDIRPGQKIITKAPSKSIFGDLNLPSGKKIAKETLQTITPINMLDASGLIPTNAKAFIADLTGLGKEEGITEKDLTKREKKALREAIKRAEAQGKDYLEYPDFASSANPNDDVGGGTFLQGFAPITKYFDPAYSMKTTLGQAKFKKNKDGTYTVTDEYNFNDATKAGFKGLIADTMVAPGLSKIAPYRILRSVARNFGSREGEGMPINITFQKGGYPKSSNKEFMRRMGYYQAGGLNQTPMYGSNTIPGTPETAAITYQEADQARLKALEEQLKEAQESTKFQDEAEAEIAKQQATIAGIEKGVGTVSKALTGDELKNEAGETLGDRLGLDKILQTGPDRFLSQTERATKALQAGKTDKFLRIADRANKGVGKLKNVGQDAINKGLSLTQTPASSGLNFATQLTPPPSILPTGSLPSSITSFTPPSLTTTPLSQLGTTTGTSLANPALGQQGANLLNTGATAGAGASKGLIGGIGPGGVGAIASIAGEGLKMASDDQDATTMNVGETVGSGLSGIGTGIGAAMTTAALLGSSLGPVGTAAGVVGGALYGLGKGLITRGKARREEKKAERKKQQEVSKLGSQARLEALKSKEYSGFDFGADVRRSGGYYQMGGAQAQQFIANQQASNQGNQNVQIPTSLLPGIKKRMNTPMSKEDRQRYGSLQMSRDASNYLEKEGTLAGFKGPEEKSTAVKAGKFIAKEAILDKVFHGLGRFAGVPGLMLSPMEAGASTVRDEYGVPIKRTRKHGGVKLPGGVAKPIPGSDAIEFKGRSHAQGGIMVDPMTEVEGNETMDQVTMKKGGKRDYFFSQHLKMGGKSFAQRHKDILKKGGSQRDIDALAKLQEKKAGRNPNTVKLGAGGYYQLGGIDPLGNVIMSDINMDGIDDFSQGISFRNDPLAPSGTLPSASEDETTVTPTTPTKPKEEEKEKERETFEFTPMPTKPVDLSKITFNPLQPFQGFPTNTNFLTQDSDGDGIPDYVDFTDNSSDPTIPLADDRTTDVEETTNVDESQISEEDKNIINKANSGADLTDFEEKALRRLRRDVPGLAIGAGLAQLIAPAYSFFKKDRVAEQVGAPGRIKAPTLDRVSFNTERAANAADNRAINRFIETSGVGPAGIIAKMSAYRRKQEGDMKIAAQEARVNTQIANREAQLQQQANIQNVQNRMRIDEINTRLREAQLAANQDRKTAAIDAFTERTAGLAGDLMSYKATERLARATGDMGNFERDRLRNFLRNRINPRTGKAYTNADIAEIFNKQFGEAQVTKEEKTDE